MIFLLHIKKTTLKFAKQTLAKAYQKILDNSFKLKNLGIHIVNHLKLFHKWCLQLFLKYKGYRIQICGKKRVKNWLSGK